MDEDIQGVTQKNIESVLTQEEAVRRNTPEIYRLVHRMATFCGSLAFLGINLAWFTVWISYNLAYQSFDPYPFPLLMLLVSLEAIFLSLLILISQNMSATESERRHHLDLQINLLAERETTAILRLLTHMAEKLDIETQHKAEAVSFSQQTNAEAVLKQIVDAEKTQHPST